MRQPRRWNGFSHESQMNSAIKTWYLVRSYDGRFRYILALTLHEHRVLLNELMFDYDCQPFDSKRLALMALSSPNVRIHADEPDPRMLCKCKRGCNKESITGSIFCSDCTRACSNFPSPTRASDVYCLQHRAVLGDHHSPFGQETLFQHLQLLENLEYRRALDAP